MEQTNSVGQAARPILPHGSMAVPSVAPMTSIPTVPVPPIPSIPHFQGYPTPSMPMHTSSPAQIIPVPTIMTLVPGMPGMPPVSAMTAVPVVPPSPGAPGIPVISGPPNFSAMPGVPGIPGVSTMPTVVPIPTMSTMSGTPSTSTPSPSDSSHAHHLKRAPLTAGFPEGQVKHVTYPTTAAVSTATNSKPPLSNSSAHPTHRPASSHAFEDQSSPPVSKDRSDKSSTSATATTVPQLSTASTYLGNAMTPPFLTKLYQLVSDPTTADLISWTDADGLSFTVHKPSDFGRDILPKYFKHNNFSSFVRQLNQYGFHKQNPDKWMFGHDNFRKDRPDLLKHITRRRPKPLPQPSSHSQSQPQSTAMITPPNPLSQNRAVVELGKYGLEGEVNALQRDKDLLIKELVTTRQAEEKLRNRCESLESRMEAMEVTTKQMQSFILHYFSHMLHPYSHAVTSRKRKRLTGTSRDSGLDIDTTPHISDGSGDAGHGSGDNPTTDFFGRNPRSMPRGVGIGVGGNPSIDTLRMMMQQMAMNVGRSSGSSGRDRGQHRRSSSITKAIKNGSVDDNHRLALTLDPETVLKISEAYVDEGTKTSEAEIGSAPYVMHNDSGQHLVNNESRKAYTMGSGPEFKVEEPLSSGGPFPLRGGPVDDGSEVIDERDISLDFLGDLGPSPGSSLTMDIIENALDPSTISTDRLQWAVNGNRLMLMDKRNSNSSRNGSSGSFLNGNFNENNLVESETLGLEESGVTEPHASDEYDIDGSDAINDTVKVEGSNPNDEIGVNQTIEQFLDFDTNAVSPRLIDSGTTTNRQTL